MIGSPARELNYMRNKRAKRFTAASFLAAVSFGLAVLLALIMAACLLFVRNPWTVHKLDASRDITQELVRAADSQAPYVQIRNMDLTYTGYYETDAAGTVLAYCYFGETGDSSVLVSIAAEDGGELARDSSAPGSVLKDASFSGRAVTGSEMAGHLAQGEGMELQAYTDQYHMAGPEIFSYGSDRERIIIYHLMLLTGIIGSAAAGGVFLSEAAARRREEDAAETDSSDDR